MRPEGNGRQRPLSAITFVTKAWEMMSSRSGAAANLQDAAALASAALLSRWKRAAVHTWRRARAVEPSVRIGGCTTFETGSSMLGILR